MGLHQYCLSKIVHLCICLILTSIHSSASPPNTLKFVSVLYRHGDRSPVSIYPKDINQVPGAWPDGTGWLSNIGKQQQYELGKFLKNRYDGFINTTRYQNEEIKIESSGVPRCLMSAYSNLAGLFPPGRDQTWNTDFPWQPIPVQTTPTETDNKLALQAECPRYDELMNQELRSPKIIKEEKDNKDFYDMVVQETGVVKESLRDIWAVGDALICERAHNMTWNSWVNKDGVWDKINFLQTWSFDLLYGLPEMAKLKGGPLLGEIVDNMQKASSETTPMPKFRMYSAHDTTTAAVLSAMQVFDCHQPPYTALVMVELHKDDSGHSVKVFYRNETNREPYQLTPPGCESPSCNLSTFIKVAKQRIPTDWESECQVQGSSSMSISPASLIALLVGLGLCGVVCLTLGVLLLRLRAKRKEIYSRI